MQDLSELTIKWHETAWMAVVRYVRLKKSCSFLEWIILEFLIWLNEVNNLQPNAIASYRRPLSTTAVTVPKTAKCIYIKRVMGFKSLWNNKKCNSS